MVSGNGASDSGSALLHCLYGGSGRGVFQHDTQLRKGLVKFEEMGNELNLCIQDMDVLSSELLKSLGATIVERTDEGSDGTSPWRFNTIPASSIAAKTG